MHQPAESYCHMFYKSVAVFHFHCSKFYPIELVYFVFVLFVCTNSQLLHMTPLWFCKKLFVVFHLFVLRKTALSTATVNMFVAKDITPFLGDDLHDFVDGSPLWPSTNVVSSLQVHL